jgi:uncharacterized protein
LTRQGPVTAGVVVLEYVSQGPMGAEITGQPRFFAPSRAIATNGAQNNRHVSVLSIVDRKISHWRDYLDPLAAFEAIGWPRALS